MKERILFVSYTAEWVGPTNSLLLLVRRLRPSYDLTVLVPGEGLFTEALKREQIRVVHLPSLTKGSIPAMARLIRRQGFNLVYGNNTGGGCRNALLAAKLARAAYIGHCRTMVQGRRKIRYSYLNLANAIIAISEPCAKALAGPVSRRKIRVVQNGVEIDQFASAVVREHGSVQRELGLRPQAPLAVSVGHLVPRKGQDDMVAALAEARRRGMDLDLLLVGRLDRDPAYVSRLRGKIERLGLENHVKLAGFRTDIPELLAAADIFIHTPVSEAFGRVVIEAMAARLPVVAYATDGVSEIVLDEETGYLVPPGDSAAAAARLTQLASDPALRRCMGMEGQRRAAEHFSAERTALQIKEVIEEVLGK